MPNFRPVALVATLLLAGCAAQRPILSPSDGLAAADRDVADCRHLADAHVPSTLPTDTLRASAIGTGIGAAGGAVGGAIFGSPGLGAAAGAASGAASALLGTLFDTSRPNPTYQSYVATCLADRGHHVVGWH